MKLPTCFNIAAWVEAYVVQNVQRQRAANERGLMKGGATATRAVSESAPRGTNTWAVCDVQTSSTLLCF